MREKIYEIIFEAETKAGKIFDIALLWMIIASVATVVIESMEAYRLEYGQIFLNLEYFFTAVFSIEYILRLYSSPKPFRYIFSFYGIIDLLAIIPGYMTLFFDGGASLMVIRGFRLLRFFRLFKLSRYVGEGDILIKALKASRYKIVVFLVTVFGLAVTVGALMYVIEGQEHGFTSIPKGIYWAIVTITTVGYGDISPQTPLGQALAMVVMIMGYGIIAVPTGIVSVELAEAKRTTLFTETCGHCMTEGHEKDAKYCRICGEPLITAKNHSV
tara:strand:+ start:1428 stop:2243 length:816 start_codon:yes stop_codon:yes gene_type:complete